MAIVFHLYSYQYLDFSQSYFLAFSCKPDIFLISLSRIINISMIILFQSTQ